MEKKINVAELLKDCPSGMELDCTIWDNIIFEEIDGNNIVIFRKSADAKVYLTQYGEFNSIDGKCVIFPKGKTTWGGFHRPFEDGDILFYKHKSNNVKYICIYKRRIDMHYLLQYCGWFSEKPHLSEQFNTKERIPLYENDDIRLATEEEKEKLFDAIKANGYRWNTETKTLEKLVEPKFKVGDKVKDKNNRVWFIVHVSEKHFDISSVPNANGYFVSIEDQDNYELVPNKFDITTLKPFESRVLVRDSTTEIWYPEFFGCLINSNNYPYMVLGGNRWKYCVPYEGNEHLLETNNDCDDYYKTWKYE